MSKHKRPVGLIAGLMLCCLLTSALPALAQTAQTPQTSILFTLSDKQGRSVSVPLRKEDVRVLENNVPQEVISVESRVEQPLSLVIMIDTSISQERVLAITKVAANEFLDKVIRPGKDSVAIVSFTGEMKLRQEMTDDVAALRRSIDGIDITYPLGYIGGGVYKPSSKNPKDDTALTQGATAIWDSVIFACDKLLSRAPVANRRAILIFSDGTDTISKTKLSEAINSSLKENVAVNSIIIGDSDFGGTEEPPLRKLAEKTGGSAVSPKKIADLRDSLSQMERDLHAPFILNFSPANKNRDGSLRKLKIEIINPELRKQGLRLSYQQGYFAR
jgi:VWFA-related protein